MKALAWLATVFVIGYGTVWLGWPDYVGVIIGLMAAPSLTR